MLLEVGRITKPHGVRGDVLVALSSDRTSRLDPGSVLDTDRGPLTVVSSSPHQDRCIVPFAGVDRRERRRDAGGASSCAPSPSTTTRARSGCTSSSAPRSLSLDGTVVGTVEEVQANPAADLLVLDTGALVPVVFVTDHAPGRVTIDPPDGLFDL